MAVVESSVYREVYYFLASAPTKEQILAFRPSMITQERVDYLLAESKEGHLSPEEGSELDEFEQVEHFVRMLKLHTRQLQQKV